ncbi:3-deoxy-D-manno-octulosonic acid transferase [Chryseobacterium sp. 6424]|uniref:3-deoxy-D-manno-octulosonic acid transferase n=1 Tax=Chryseobacterium sp. 6424 TaxID=2039166 RepID=UPI000EFDA511|nr:glycosyltransferase N-terminal domain-containing protein [Chryseobacterium sp. 6424]AYO56946.1 3-deoxy-D-manno-octulosonic acid transferase [Chryseobacterium sp. 6424]
MKTIYRLFINLLVSAMKIGALFNYKLKKGLAGRRQSCEIVQRAFSPSDKVIWMHAASLGEYEQGMPVLEKLKEKLPEHKVLITFFSPSGYEYVVRRSHLADAVCYLPFDTEKWVKAFTAHFTPVIFITVKYEYWYHLLAEVKNRGAKVYVVSALFYETQLFFKTYGKWFVKQLQQHVDWFFHQTKHSTALAKSLGLHQSSTAGDTRYDRVKKLREEPHEIDFIADFVQGSKTVVFGSSWESEERLAEIVHSKNHDIKLLIAPHDLKRVPALKQLFPNAVLYSQLSGGTPFHHSNSRVLIIDCIGLLSRLYSYASVAVVGGGFHTKGLHNILEAAVFGVPVLFGAQYRKNPEADALVAAHGAKSFEDEFFAAPFLLGLLKDETLRQQMGQNAAEFILQQPNATENVLAKLLP